MSVIDRLPKAPRPQAPKRQSQSQRQSQCQRQSQRVFVQWVPYKAAILPLFSSSFLNFFCLSPLFSLHPILPFLPFSHLHPLTNFVSTPFTLHLFIYIITSLYHKHPLNLPILLKRIIKKGQCKSTVCLQFSLYSHHQTPLFMVLINKLNLLCLPFLFMYIDRGKKGKMVWSMKREIGNIKSDQKLCSLHTSHPILSSLLPPPSSQCPFFLSFSTFTFIPSNLLIEGNTTSLSHPINLSLPPYIDPFANPPQSQKQQT